MGSGEVIVMMFFKKAGVLEFALTFNDNNFVEKAGSAGNSLGLFRKGQKFGVMYDNDGVTELFITSDKINNEVIYKNELEMTVIIRDKKDKDDMKIITRINRIIFGDTFFYMIADNYICAINPANTDYLIMPDQTIL